MNHGLSERDINTIFTILRKYPSIEEVWIFGSRAKGTFHKGSDIDLALINNIENEKVIYSVLSDFEDSTLPYFVDFVNFSQLKQESLKEHILNVGQPFYQKETMLIASEPTFNDD